MRKNNRLLFCILTFMILVWGFTDLVWARGFEKYDFTLRFPAALSRISTYPDVAGFGGASAGSPWSSSINPAATAWKDVNGYSDIVLAPIYTNISFDEGTNFHIGVMSFVWGTEHFGTFQPTFIQAYTNTATERSGLEFDFSAIGGNLQWGRKIDNNKAVGINLNILNSNTDFSLGNAIASGTDSETYGLRIGGLIQPWNERFLLGLAVDYTYGPARTTTFDVLGLGVGTIYSTDLTEQVLVRPGISFEYLKNSRIYLDYQYGYIDVDTGTLKTHRFFTGLEQKTWKILYFRTGTTVDVHANVAWTLGVGIYPHDSLSIDLGYQKDMFPELEMEFGDSETLTASASFVF